MLLKKYVPHVTYCSKVSQHNHQPWLNSVLQDRSDLECLAQYLDCSIYGTSTENCSHKYCSMDHVSDVGKVHLLRKNKNESNFKGGSYH